MNWFFRYKLYHIPFWIAYHLLWMMINVGTLDGVIAYLFQGDLPVKFLGYIVFQAAGAYFNLYYLIPRYLYPGRYLAYIGLVITTILLCSTLITGGYYLGAYLSELSFWEMYHKQPEQFFSIFGIMVLPSTAASMTLAMSVKLAKNWLAAEKNRHVLEKEKLETELKYLKSQINPHFLFNTINSIFVLIHKNPDLASESLASFSDMLRYQLYECNDAEIALRKELDFLENFIELESLRLNENQTELAFDINHQAAEGVAIAPFILLPFVENAFKHVSKGKTQDNFIRMGLHIDEAKILNLQLENSRNGELPERESGIGLKNVQRRLNLIYPHKHRLLIDTGANTFKIGLSIDLA